MAIPEIPVWTIKPNWREAITERLEWLTSVIGSDNGTEQRVAHRLSPRRSFEMAFNPVEADRSYFGLFLHRLAAEEFFLPLFHDKAKLSASVSATGTALAFDNTYREFETGGYGLLISGTFRFEVVEITAQSSGGLTVAPLAGAWPAGTTLHPLRIARLADESALAALTGNVGRATVLFNLARANDFDEGVRADEYAGYPIMLTPPNRRESLDLSFARNVDTVDSETGLVSIYESADRAFTVQMHQWLIRGRQEHAEFRSMLYRLRGRQKAVWLPTFNDDFRLRSTALAAHTALTIDEIGYGYTGGVVSGRNHVLLTADDGTKIAREITSLAAPPATGQERFNLSSALGANVSAGRTGSFLEIARLDQDRIEITHHTDSSGVSECRAAFRSFLDEREEDELVEFPIAGGTMNDDPCGTPAEPDPFAMAVSLAYTGPGESYRPCEASDTATYEIGGTIGVTYEAVIWVRGIYEEVNYSSGSDWPAGPPNVKTGTSTFAVADGSTLKLAVSDPPVTYTLNHGQTFDSFPDDWDFYITIPVKGGATLTLTLDSTNGEQLGGGGYWNGPGWTDLLIDPGFSGQWCQIDLLSVT